MPSFFSLDFLSNEKLENNPGHPQRIIYALSRLQSLCQKVLVPARQCSKLPYRLRIDKPVGFRMALQRQDPAPSLIV